MSERSFDACVCHRRTAGLHRRDHWAALVNFCGNWLGVFGKIYHMSLYGVRGFSLMVEHDYSLRTDGTLLHLRFLNSKGTLVTTNWPVYQVVSLQIWQASFFCKCLKGALVCGCSVILLWLLTLRVLNPLPGYWVTNRDQNECFTVTFSFLKQAMVPAGNCGYCKIVSSLIVKVLFSCVLYNKRTHAICFFPVLQKQSQCLTPCSSQRRTLSSPLHGGK